MKDQFRRILNLVRHTGDTMVVTDTNGEDVYVIMDIDQYELLLNMEENGLDADLNDECLEEDESDEFIPQEPDVHAPTDIWEAMKPAGEEGDTWDPSAMNEAELADLEKQYHAFTQKNVQTAIQETEKTVEKIPEKPDEFGEESFYLEPVE